MLGSLAHSSEEPARVEIAAEDRGGSREPPARQPDIRPNRNGLQEQRSLEEQGVPQSTWARSLRNG